MAKSLFRLCRPIYLLLAALAYLLGAGIARYLGQGINAVVLALGLLIALSLLAAAFLLAEYFGLSAAPLRADETLRQRREFRRLLLASSYLSSGLAASLVLALFLTHALPLLAGALCLLTFLLVMVYAVPPLRLAESGFGEFVLSALIAVLFPALAFLFQTNEFHRLLPLMTFPLFFLALAWLLILDFPRFAADQRVERRTLLTRLTWQWAVPTHHFLILMAFLLFAAAPLLGLSWALVGPVFLALPFYAFQIIWLQHIAAGGRTLWSFFTALATASFGLVIYLLTSAFWAR